MVEKATGQVFGSISVYNALLGEPQQKAKWPGLELSGGIWEPGYCIGQKWWGKGLTTEALQAVVDFWFNQVGGAFLTCCHAVQNPASGRVMERPALCTITTTFTTNLTAHRWNAGAIC